MGRVGEDGQVAEVWSICGRAGQVGLAGQAKGERQDSLRLYWQ